MAVLRPSIIPAHVQNPYYFEETGIRVYSFEELLYHCFHHWRSSIDEFLSGNLEVWVGDCLGLTFLSKKIEQINNSDLPLTEKYMSFLALENLFDMQELKPLKMEISSWENKSRWERVKNKGDAALAVKNYEKAAEHYIAACEFTEQYMIYNNLGICFSRLGQFEEAEKALLKAERLANDHLSIKLNLAALYIGQNLLESASHVLAACRKLDKAGKTAFFLGKLKEEEGNYKEARVYYDQSYEEGNRLEAGHAICDILIKQKIFTEAVQILNEIKDLDYSAYLYKLAMIYETTGDRKKAVKMLLESLIADEGSIQNWIYLGRLHRKNGDLEKAYGALVKALNISPQNEQALLEMARIKQAQQKPRERQGILKGLLNKWKNGYRKVFEWQ